MFARLPFIEGPELSPSGDRIAARMAVNGVQRLAIINVADTSKRALINAGDLDLNWWQWVNDDWLVVGYGATQNVFGDTWYVSRAAGVSADGTKIVPLLDRSKGQDADDLIWVASERICPLL